MNGWTWVQIRSWHAYVGGGKTLCGRTVTAAVPVDFLPAGKSCETCLRSVARRVDG